MNENINDLYKPRLLDKTLERYLKIFGAVVIEGPKYCGKTWTGRKFAKSERQIAPQTVYKGLVTDRTRSSRETVRNLNFCLEK